MTRTQPASPQSNISLLGVRVDNATLDELVRHIELGVLQDQKVILANVNIHAMNLAYSLPWFRRFLNQSQLTICDGVGVSLAARMTGQTAPRRLTFPDIIDTLCGAASREGWRVYFLGAEPGVAEMAAQKLLAQHTDLQIRTHHGFFDKEVNSEANRAVVHEINQFRPNVLFVGFGMTLQEKWISENLESLEVNAILPTGAMFDYISGRLYRFPRWMTDRGLEWLGRLLVEPRRLWRRYVIGNPLFFWRVFRHHFVGVPLPEN